jgi:dipeptidyl aminopeptidase/acylaminoacyl peptidase
MHAEPRIEPPVMTIDQAMSAERLAGSRISPDGRLVIYGVGRTDWQADRFVTDLWIASVATGERYRLTTGGASRWSPDGNRIAFLSDRGGSSQIYLIRPAGGEAVRLTDVPGGISFYRWSPDGRHIAFLTNDPEPQSARARREKSGDLEIMEGGKEGPGAFAGSHLWLIDLPEAGQKAPAASPVRLTGGSAFTINEFEWSPDGRRIAFAAVTDPTPRGRASSDIYLLELAGRIVTRIVDTPGPDTYPVWSPDGSEIAFETANGSLTYFETNRYVAAVPVSGGRPRLLTQKVDEQASLLAWGPKGIYVAVQKRTDLYLYRLNPVTKAMTRIKAPAGLAFQQWTFTSDYRRMAFTGASASSYPEMYVGDLKGARSRRLTRFNDQFDAYRQATREVISWRSSDGALIDGVLIKPAGFDPAKAYPLLVVVHGGPADVDRPLLGPAYAYPIDQLAAKGAIVLRPNYRGSIGYGEAFRAPDPRTLSDYEDVMAGVKQLVDRGLADRSRIGVMGWSQGGYLAALLATKGSDWFRAASVGASVPNWLTYYNSGDAGYWAAQWFKATPLEDMEVYRLKSPMSYLAGAKTPILIQHGENDRRAPIAGAYELYRALEDRHVPVKMIVYKGAGHGIGTPKGQRALMEQNLEWFGRWIWSDEPDPADSFRPMSHAQGCCRPAGLRTHPPAVDGAARLI